MTDYMFHVVEDAHVILLSGGVYRQVKVYTSAGQLYAAWAGGFIRLTAHGTTHPKVNWLHILPPPGSKLTKGGSMGAPAFGIA